MMMRLVVVLAATTPAASFKLPWSRSAPKSGGYQLGDISKIDSMYDKGKDSEPVQALLAVGKTLMHGCPLIMWEDVTSCVEINQ